jgi:TP901 family phage tail tape measure protein
VPALFSREVDTLADYTITGDTKLDAGGFNKGLSSMTVAAGTLIADLVKTATGKLTGLAQASVGVGMSFDASMSQVAATMGTSIDQIQNLTDTAKEMGRTTAFTATQAADALNYLALAGYDADKAAEVLPSVLSLAAAGGMDLAYASDLVTDAMASLNIEANKQNVDEFGNKLAMAASKANANVSQLGEAILTVGGTAANLKGGTTELTTALGLLANVGIKGAEGGTHLRNIILSLQSPTKDAREVMEQLGLEVYDTQGNMRQLDDILTDLNTSMSGMTQGGKDSVINQLFNKTDLAAVNGLLAAQGEQWETLATQIDNAGGAMGQMADTQLDNLQGAVTIMQSALEGLQLAIYDKMEPALKVLAQGATETISTLTAILSQDGPAAMLDAAVTIMGSLVNGITQKIPMVMSAATGIIIKLTQYLGNHADDLFDAGIKILKNLITGIQNNLPALITAAAQLLAKFAAALTSHLPDLLQCGASLLQAIVNGILLGIANLGEAAIACVAKIVGVWDGSYTEWGNIGTNIVLGIKNGIIGAWDGLVSGVKSKVAGMVDSVKGLLGIHSPSKVFDEIGMNICKGLAQGLTTNGELAKDAAAQVVASVTNTATTLADGIETVTQSVTETLKDGTTQQKQTITSTGTEIIDGVEHTVKTVTTIAADGTKTVSKTIEDAGPQFSSAAELLTYQFTEKLNSSWEQINKSIQSDVVGSIQTLFKAIKDGDLESIATWSAAYFWNACTQEQRTQIQTFAMDALGKLSGSLSGVFKNLASLAAGFIGQFVPAATAATGAQTGLNIAMDANPILLVISLIGMLVGALGSFIATNKNASSSVKSIWGGIGDFMSYIFEGLLRVYGSYLQGFVNIINGLIKVYNAVAWLWDSHIDPVSNIAFDYADKIRKEREERKAAEKAEAERAKAQAQLDAQYAKQSGTAEKKQLDAKYNKKLAELEKAKLTKDDPGMLEAEKKVLAAGYEQDLADLEKKVLDARYKLASAQLEKKTTTDAARLAELEKQINEAQNVIQMSDLEKQLLGVEYQKSLAELIAKYQPKKDNTSSGSSSSGSSPSNSDELANKISDLEKSYNQKLQELKNTYTNKGEAQSAEYERRLADLKADYEKQLAALKKQLTEKNNSSDSLSAKLSELEQDYNRKLQELNHNSTVKDAEYDRKLAALKADYEKQLAELKRQYSSSSGSSGTGGSSGSSGSTNPVPKPDTDHDKVIEDNTAALVEANKKLAEMVRQANALVLSDNMKVSNRVAASGTAQVAAAAGNYHREGDTTVNQYIYSKAQTAADLAREARWEADHAKAKKR